MRSLCLVIASASLILGSNFVRAGEFKHQHIEPAKLVNPWNAPDETYVEPSVIEKLKPGNRVAVPDFGDQGKWYIQRLTERT